MTKPELILHIGHTKCGSTAIQRFLIANREALAKEDVYMFNADLTIGGETNIKGLPNFILADESNWDCAAERIRNAAQQAKPGDRFVLTAEIMSQPKKADFIKRFIDLYDTKVIHYIRRQDDWCYSAWKQWQLKRGVTLQEWSENCSNMNLPPYMQTFERYKNLGVAPGKYRMKILDKQFLLSGDLIEDFCFEAEIDASTLKRLQGQINPNFDRALLEVFRAADFLFVDPHDNEPFDWVLNNPQCCINSG